MIVPSGKGFIIKSHKGKKFSEEHRKNLSKAGKGKKHKPCSEETKQLLSEKLKGRVFTTEHRQNLSKAGKGRKFSDEHRINIGKARKGKYPTKETGIKISTSGWISESRGSEDLGFSSGIF